MSAVMETLTAAVRYHQAGDLRRAEEKYRRVLDSDPDQADALHLLGVIAHQEGRHQAAAEQIRRAIAVNPGAPAFHGNLGNVYQALRQYAEAVRCYQRAIQISPDFAVAHGNLGNALLALGNVDQAAACCRRAVELGPDLADAHNNLGTVLQHQGDWQGAFAAFQQALQIDPRHPEALANLAAFYERTNRVEEAAETAQVALNVSPHHARANFVAARCQARRSRPWEAIDRLLTARPFIEAGTEAAEEIGYELGRLYDQVGDAERAFAELTEANRTAMQRASHWGLENRRFLQMIETLRATFTAEWVRSWSPTPPSDADAGPVFLVGFPRSGTTLLEVALDNHPHIQTADEKPALVAVRQQIQRMPGGYPQALAELPAGAIDRLRKVYFEAMDGFLQRRPGALLIDKLPLNVIHCGLIHRLFPKAKFIFTARHPCDVCLSCFMQTFKPNAAMASCFCLEDTATLYDAAMRLWRQYTRVLDLDYHVVKYERLVDDFQGEARRLVAFLGIEWHEAVLDRTQAALRRGRISTPSYHQVATPIYRAACHRWRKYERHLTPILDTLKPHVRWLGYEDSADAAVKVALPSEYAVTSPPPSAPGSAGGSHPGSAGG